MSTWWRAYSEAVDDPKLQRLPDALFKAWFNLMCLAAKNKGRVVNDISYVAFSLRITRPSAAVYLLELHDAGLITYDATFISVVAWEEQQSGRPPAHEWLMIRKRIFERDNFTCRYCGIRGVRLECDHVVPVARGGGHDDNNLATSCFDCNRSKRDKLLSEWQS